MATLTDNEALNKIVEQNKDIKKLLKGLYLKPEYADAELAKTE